RVHLGQNHYDGYYLYRTSTGWSNPIKIFSNIERGNQIRVAIDANNRVHIIHPEHIVDGFCKVSYLQIYNGSISISHSQMTGTYENKANDHIEIDVSQDGKVYIVLGCPDPGRAQRIFISNNAGGSFEAGVDFRAADVIHNQSVCGSPDVFVDEGGISHVMYGTTRDASRNYQSSVRYARFQNGEMRLNIPISSLNEMGTWDPGQGIGSVAASDEGQFVLVVYSKKDAGELRYRFSEDYGANFSSPTQLETSAGGYSGRDKAKVRAYKKRFYLVYTKNNSVYLRFYSVPGYNPPTANAGGPYTGIEGTPITFSAALSSDDIGLSKYEWDWDNDGIYDDQTTVTTIQHSFPDEYSGTIKLRVTDDTNLTSVAQGTVTITNADPIPAMASSFSGQEGSPVTLSVTPNDPGVDDTHTYSWDFGDGQTSTEASPAHSFPDNGNYLVQVTVYDDDGGNGQAQTTAVISNVNPTASAGGPYNTRMGTPTPLNAIATDPAGDNDPLTYAWDIDNDGVYDLSGQTVQAIFTSEGTQTIKLQVNDDDGGIATATGTVNVGKAAPIISEIGAQIVNEGTAFRTIDLDNYTEDMDTPDNQLEWAQSGAESLLVYLDFTTHELSVEVPHEEWSGTENIRLEVHDPNNNTAQQIVEFTVQAVNDNPTLKNIPAQFIAEDDTLIMRWNSLVLLASDPDNKQADFSFSIINNLNTRSHWDNTMKALLIYGKSNWSGEETITMKVTDGSGGVGTKDFQVWVTPVPDAPDDFSLTSPLNEAFSMWPETIQFRWNASNDPDAGEGVVYRWVLSRYDNFQSILERSPDMIMNSYTFTNTKGRDPGLYYWRVEAEGDDGLVTYSTNYGILNLSSKQPVISYVPDRIINEGENFEDIHLDAIVTDADNSKDELYWQVQGEDQLVVIISNDRIA
ncbi:PKD domain-containing protein, partial [bacterium]|nr:PKD domain-containing protein [bacterium]